MSGVIDHGDGAPVELAAPFSHIEVVYPFLWASPNRVHVFDRREGSGTVYSPEYARALATAILTAMGDRVLTPEEKALAAEALAIGQESVDDYADQFSDVDARLDEGKTRAAAAGMRALAARLNEAAS